MEEDTGGLLSLEETAKLLGVATKTVLMMVRRGQLHPTYLRSRGTYFHPADVAIVTRLKEQEYNLLDVAGLALRALVLAQRNERRLNQISDLLGLNVPLLPTEEASVIELYGKARDLLVEEERVLETADVFYWANVFYAFDEAYLRLVKQACATLQPWEPFLSLAQALCEGVPREVLRLQPELAEAYAYLEVGRRHLRVVVYCYFRSVEGPDTANRAFTDIDLNDDREILRIARTL